MLRSLYIRTMALADHPHALWFLALVAFVESSVSDRSMRALIEGAAAQGHEVSIGGELFSDAMGAEGTYEGTYLGMLDHNITVIAGALGADIPKTGMSGNLSAGF